MIIRTYTADSVANALKQVRTEMGGEAVVLKTRVVDSSRGQREYEVTACLDKPSVEQANRSLTIDAARAAVKSAARPVAASATVSPRIDLSDVTPTKAPATADNDARLTTIEAKLDSLLRAGIAPAAVDPRTQEIVDRLRASDMPDQMVQTIIDDLKASGRTVDVENARALLAEKLSGVTDLHLEFNGGDRVLVLGPAGAGKTSVLGKLAAGLVTERRLAVRLTAFDSSKIGALDELESYGALLGMSIDHHAAGGPVDKNQVLLIDSGALPVSEADVENLKARIEKLAPTHRLAVVSALTRAADMTRQTARAATLGATHLAVTMTDMTNGWGAVIAAAETAGLKLAFVSDSPAGAGRLTQPDARTVSDVVFGREDVRE